ncbi:MAG: sodium-translocating pyrophosphatase [Spirochaetes bacterium]|nr:sodium-translocating pyrophosphatase [Spirochaetota bacterium]
MKIELVLGITILGSAIALIYSFIRTKWINKQPVENEKLKQISGFVADGAMAFLAREYKTLLTFAVIVAAFLAIGNQGFVRLQSAAFIVGAICSGLAGYIGMKVATRANARTTTAAANSGISAALKVAFASGSVMGMSVVGLALFGMLIVLVTGLLITGNSIVNFSETITREDFANVILPIITGFGLGVSSIALFARVGGGIFTKAADVGADLVGKVEAGIPEDDPRNPAVIADNVGDNVGDVAGMGADLFESYVGAIIGAMVLGAVLPVDSISMQLTLIFLPLVLCVVGIVCSLIGILCVRAKPNKSPQTALNTGMFVAAILTAIATFPISFLFFGDATFGNGIGALNVALASVVGLVTGIGIGLITEYFTGTNKRPVNSIVKACETGPATTIITGLGIGMLSCFPAVLLITVAIVTSFVMAGLYGIAIAGLGMLLTLGVQLAVDAYGPVADNAGGMAEMAGFPEEVRVITDKLDAVGNTTAAIGKGFAIGSAALTAIILFSAFKETMGIPYIDITNAWVIAGVIFGATIPFLFSALAIIAVGKAAFYMVEEVRRQFREKPGILKNTELPDYKKCVDISTAGALKKMMLPGVIAVITPVIVGFAAGPEMLVGLLIGVTASGVVMAIFMANSGGAWDNAKKMIEADKSIGKGSPSHKAAVVGDTVGDPFKDTSGPSLNTLMKLMCIVALVIAPMLKAFHGM